MITVLAIKTKNKVKVIIVYLFTFKQLTSIEISREKWIFLKLYEKDKIEIAIEIAMRYGNNNFFSIIIQKKLVKQTNGK